MRKDNSEENVESNKQNLDSCISNGMYLYSYTCIYFMIIQGIKLKVLLLMRLIFIVGICD